MLYICSFKPGIMLFNLCNKDCNEYIYSFIDVSSLSKLMQCNLEFNKKSMEVLGTRYKRSPLVVYNKRNKHRNKPMTILRSFHVNERCKLQQLLGNGKYGFMNLCMICKQFIPKYHPIVIQGYGLFAHELCVSSREKKITNSYARPYMMKLRTRIVRGEVMAIEFNIPDVYPEKYTLSGQDIDGAMERASQEYKLYWSQF